MNISLTIVDNWSTKEYAVFKRSIHSSSSRLVNRRQLSNSISIFMNWHAIYKKWAKLDTKGLEPRQMYIYNNILYNRGKDSWNCSRNNTIEGHSTTIMPWTYLFRPYIHVCAHAESSGNCVIIHCWFCITNILPSYRIQIETYKNPETYEEQIIWKAVAN